MLSETTFNGTGDYGSALGPLLYARGSKARLLSIIGGALLLAGIGWILPRHPDLPITTFMLVPVLLVSWYAGSAAGVWAAIAACTSRLVVDLAAGVTYSSPAVPYWNLGTGLILFLAVARLLPRLRESVYREREISMTDPLTKLGNRRFFGELAAIELNRTRRYQRPLVMAYLNVDAFERFNERHGYAEGDALLILMAGVIRSCLRTSDVVARIAADEFAVLLPETHPDGARVAVEKIQQHLAAAVAVAGQRVTFSIAAITYAEGPVSLEGMLRQADAVMFEAKRSGGNAIRCAAYEHPLVAAL